MRAWLIPVFLAFTGCATYYGIQLDDRYGAPDPARYDRMAASYPAEEYAKVRTIVDQRCSVCHGCNDAPCQLNLASHEGLTRGANRERVYGTRLAATAPTRLFFDAQSAAQWRASGRTATRCTRRGNARSRRKPGSSTTTGWKTGRASARASPSRTRRR